MLSPLLSQYQIRACNGYIRCYSQYDMNDVLDHLSLSVIGFGFLNVVFIKLSFENALYITQSKILRITLRLAFILLMFVALQVIGYDFKSCKYRLDIRFDFLNAFDNVAVNL